MEVESIVLCADAEKKGGNNDPSCKNFPNSNTQTTPNYLDGKDNSIFSNPHARARVDFALSKPPQGHMKIDYSSIGPKGCCANGCADC